MGTIEATESLPAIEKLQQRWLDLDHVVGVGLDPRIPQIPQEYYSFEDGVLDERKTVFGFCRSVIDATSDLAVDYKANSHFFRGMAGKAALHDVALYLRETVPGAVFVIDGKFGEVGHTTEEIVDEVFNVHCADATLVNPYLGADGVLPFSSRADKITVVCVKTSNPSSAEVQDTVLEGGTKLWERILDLSLSDWNEHNNVIPVLSATYPADLVDIRDRIGQTPILIGGVGTQAGEMQTTVGHCMDENGYGMLISASRKIIYPDQNPGEKHPTAVRRALMGLIKEYREAREGVRGGR